MSRGAGSQTRETSAEPAAAAAERCVCTRTQSGDEEQSGSKWKAMRRERGAATINEDDNETPSVQGKSCRMEIGGLVPTINAVSQRGRRNYRTIDRRVGEKKYIFLKKLREEIEAVIRKDESELMNENRQTDEGVEELIRSPGLPGRDTRRRLVMALTTTAEEEEKKTNKKPLRV